MKKVSCLILVFMMCFMLGGCKSEKEKELDDNKEAITEYIDKKYHFEPELVSWENVNKGTVFSCTGNGKNFKVRISSTKSLSDDFQAEEILNTVKRLTNADYVDLIYGDNCMLNKKFNGDNIKTILSDGTMLLQFINQSTKDLNLDRYKEEYGVGSVYCLNVDSVINSSELLDKTRTIESYFLEVTDYNITDVGYDEFKVTKFDDLYFLDNVKVRRIKKIDLITFGLNKKNVIKSYQINKLKKKKSLDVYIPVTNIKIKSGDKLAYRYSDHYVMKYKKAKLKLTDDGKYYKGTFKFNSDSIKFTVMRG